MIHHDIEGYLEVVAAFAELHPSTLADGGQETWLSSIGARTPVLELSGEEATRLLVWMAEHLSQDAPRSLFDWARGLLRGVAEKHVGLVLTLLQNARDKEARRALTDVVRYAVAPVFESMRNTERFVELEQQSRRALVHDPEASVYRASLLAALSEQRRFDEAEALGREWLATHDDADIALLTAAALASIDRTPEAFSLLDRHAPQLRGTPRTAPFLNTVLECAVRSRDLDSTLRVGDRWFDIGNEVVRGLPLLAPIASEIARWYVRIGDFPRAIRFVTLSRARGLTVAQIRNDPDLAPLRGQAAFDRALLERESDEDFFDDDLGD